MTVRLHKWLAQLGLASRREAEAWIASGRISVNGKRVKRQGQLVTPGVDEVLLDGKPLPKRPPTRRYYALNKPDLVLTSRRPEDRKFTIYDLPKVKRLATRVNPIGRLDFRTEGLLLLSNDGELSHRLTRVRARVPRVYSVLLPKPLPPEKEAKIRKGLYFDDGPVKGVELERRNRTRMGSSRGQWYRVVVHEGRNRLVRRMFAAVGANVVRLVRVGFAGVKLPPGTKPGDVVPLRESDVAMLRKGAGLE